MRLIITGGDKKPLAYFFLFYYVASRRFLHIRNEFKNPEKFQNPDGSQNWFRQFISLNRRDLIECSTEHFYSPTYCGVRCIKVHIEYVLSTHAIQFQRNKSHTFRTRIHGDISCARIKTWDLNSIWIRNRFHSNAWYFVYKTRNAAKHFIIYFCLYRFFSAKLFSRQLWFNSRKNVNSYPRRMMANLDFSRIERFSHAICLPHEQIKCHDSQHLAIFFRCF